MTHVTCRLTVENRNQLRNPTLSNRVWATFNLFYLFNPAFGCQILIARFVSEGTVGGGRSSRGMARQAAAAAADYRRQGRRPAAQDGGQGWLSGDEHRCCRVRWSLLRLSRRRRTGSTRWSPATDGSNKWTSGQKCLRKAASHGRCLPQMPLYLRDAGLHLMWRDLSVTEKTRAEGRPADSQWPASGSERGGA